MTPSAEEITRAVAVLRAGGLVAFPTETVYGLGADAAAPAAMRRLFAAKGRPADHPVIVHVGSVESVSEWVTDIPGYAASLAAECWPGPLTLVLPRSERVPDEVTGGLDTVGIRVPAEQTALALLREFAGGIAAPSANRFGHVSPTSAQSVRDELGDAVDIVLDGGPSAVGVESTIVDCSGRAPAILRLGGVARERIEEITGRPVPLLNRGEVRAPGTLAKHYAPAARVILVDDSDVAARAQAEVARGARVGVIAPKPADDVPAGAVLLGAPVDACEYARSLYQWLRDADAIPVDVVVAAAPAEVGIGAAVSDRLRRAAAGSAS